MLVHLENFLQALSAGILIGGRYGLMCVGLGMIFGVMRVINFGEGDLMMVGMYCAYYLFGVVGIGQFFGADVGSTWRRSSPARSCTSSARCCTASSFFSRSG